MMERPRFKPQEHIVYDNSGEHDLTEIASEILQPSTSPTSIPASDADDLSQGTNREEDALEVAFAVKAEADQLADEFQASLENEREKKHEWDRLLEQLRRTQTELRADLAHLASSRQDHEQALVKATQDINQTEETLDQRRRQLAEAHAQAHQWREIIYEAKKLRQSIQQHPQAPDLTLRLAQAHEAYLQTEASAMIAQKALRQGKGEQLKAQITCRRLGRVRRGVSLSGFANYLQRAPKAQAGILKKLVAQAQERGRERAGRRPATSKDPRSQVKQKRAAAKREQRKAQPRKDTMATRGDSPDQVQPGPITTGQAFPAPAHGTIGQFVPVVRQHDQRMASMSPDMQVVYQHHLDISRQRGRDAALADVSFRQALGTPTLYQAPHGAVPLPDHARLIGLRGDGFETELVAMIEGKDHLTEWLLEPSRKRNARKGRKSRLKQGALHLVLAYPDLLAGQAASGAWDRAFSYQLDSVLARFHMEGHRAAAFLHLDSASGHPHLHIVISRVRTSDWSVWSLAGRERTPALWLHGRAHTAITFGNDTLARDIDALGGWGDAAVSGEILMANNALTATRTPLEGPPITIPLQGPEAAQRLHAVGHCSDRLGGGIWRYGLGPDPEARDAWLQALGQAQKDGDHDKVRSLMSHRPPNRGGWGDGDMNLEPGRFLAYLQRITASK